MIFNTVCAVHVWEKVLQSSKQVVEARTRVQRSFLRTAHCAKEREQVRVCHVPEQVTKYDWYF